MKIFSGHYPRVFIIQKSLLCKGIWEEEGVSSPFALSTCGSWSWADFFHSHGAWLPRVSVVCMEDALPAVFGLGRVWLSHQKSFPLTSFPWGQGGPYGSITLLQQMLWTYTYCFKSLFWKLWAVLLTPFPHLKRPQCPVERCGSCYPSQVIQWN